MLLTDESIAGAKQRATEKGTHISIGQIHKYEVPNIIYCMHKHSLVKVYVTDLYVSQLITD